MDERDLKSSAANRNRAAMGEKYILPTGYIPSTRGRTHLGGALPWGETRLDVKLCLPCDERTAAALRR